MAWSKSTRIIILLVIDTAFFLLELATGYAVHSLALVADAFHMLNDVLSLCVGLWAVWAANQTNHPKRYTYGYQRAETLGALVNGVFLVALCVTIFLEAISRLVDPPEITQPVLILVVGCLGLASNLVGLLLFHDHSHGGHGHSHGGHDHSHGHAHNDLKHAEEGNGGHDHAHDHENGAANQSHSHGEAADAKSSNWLQRIFSKKPVHDHDHDHDDHHSHGDQSANPEAHPASAVATLPSSHAHSKVSIVEPAEHRHETTPASASSHKRKSSRSTSKGVPGPDEAFANGPGGFRNSIIAAGRLSDDDVIADEHDGHSHNPTEALLGGRQANGQGYGSIGSQARVNHHEHNHAKPKRSEGGSGGHSHGDLNMRGIFLHVMGDALGNVGVIATALFIWKTDFWWRFYFDPIISLFITFIILLSAIPLCKAASRILLQAVPSGIEIDDIKDDIEQIPGLHECHHLHVWQLSDTKLVASLHVIVNFDFEGEGSARYMELAKAVRECLHGYGIHSSTIQPEFLNSGSLQDLPESSRTGPNSPTGSFRRQLSERGESSCLLECSTEDCGDGSQSCCPPQSAN